mmetsp:Transcript_39705/g.109344  ORF Transcript_39705/g.109344 Transcript_39705/m.109344 type:complete len:235 (-) Transcript_39705:192-896(-)
MVERVRLGGELILDPREIIDDGLSNRESLLGQAGSHRIATHTRAPLGLEAGPVVLEVVAPAGLIPRSVVRLDTKRPRAQVRHVPEHGVLLGHEADRLQHSRIVHLRAELRAGHLKVLQQHALRDQPGRLVLHRAEVLRHAHGHASRERLVEVPLALVQPQLHRDVVIVRERRCNLEDCRRWPRRHRLGEHHTTRLVLARDGLSLCRRHLNAITDEDAHRVADVAALELGRVHLN